MKHDSNPIIPNPADLLGPIVEAVLQAGSLLRAEFHRPGGPRGAHGKAPIDVEIEERLREQLLALHACDWHGEEIPRSFRGTMDVWVVDPQDGTRAFLNGLRGSAISVALMREARPVLGVVYAPTAPDDGGDLFTWAEGLPLTRNGVRIEPKLASSTGLYCFDTVLAMNEEAADYAAANHDRFAPASVLALPSIAYRLALAAVGEVDAAISLTRGLDPYDIAGGQALLHAMGGALVQLSGKTVSYDRHASYQGCVGGSSPIVSEVLRRNPGPGRRVERRPARPARRISSTVMLSRAQGVLLGQLSGDALGSQVEFMLPDRIRRLYPDDICNLQPGGTWDTLAGQPTDDSEMALALARTLVEKGEFDRPAIAQSYIDWARSGPFDIGGTTSRGIAALAGRGSPSVSSQANGALMRVSPVGIFAAGKPALAARLAREDAKFTHPHPVCQAASAAFAAAIAAGIAGADHRAMWAIGFAHAGEDDGAAVVRACLERSLTEGPADFSHNQGWVLTALGNAFHRLYAGQSVGEALIETVMAGGDTDTNAAICGALLGAAWGRAHIPRRWRRLVLACRAVHGDDVRHPRAGDLLAGRRPRPCRGAAVRQQGDVRETAHVHASGRCRQRRISPEVVDVILAYGRRTRSHGADICCADRAGTVVAPKGPWARPLPAYRRW